MGVKYISLSSSNILVDSNGVIKISDIFIDLFIDMMPTVKEDSNISKYFELGCLILEMATKKLFNFQECSNIEQVIRDLDLFLTSIPNIKISFSELCVSFIKECFYSKNLETIKSHPFLTSQENLFIHKDPSLSILGLENRSTNKVMKRKPIYNILNTSEENNPLFTISLTVNTPQSNLGLFKNFLIHGLNEKKVVLTVEEQNSSKEHSPKDDDKRFFEDSSYSHHSVDEKQSTY
jgi:hypothetical protein